MEWENWYLFGAVLQIPLQTTKQQYQQLEQDLDRIYQMSQHGEVTREMVAGLDREHAQSIRKRERRRLERSRVGLVEDTLRRYSRASGQGKASVWVPPSLEDVSECARARPYSLSGTYFDKTAGKVFKSYREPPKTELSPEDYQKVEAELISALFTANGYTTHLVKTQELMLGEFSPVDFYFEPIPVRNGLPEPPVDIRAPLVCIYTLLTSHTRFEPDILPVLVAPRVCQLVEAAFWLTHCVVFADQKTSVKCGQLLEMRRTATNGEKEQENDALPDYLNVRAANLTA